MATTTVLITAAGSASGLNLIRALRSQNELSLRLVAVDADPYSPGLLLADAGHAVPAASDPAYVPCLLDICRRESANVLMPTHSAEVPVIAEGASVFRKSNVNLVLPSKDSVLLFQDKWETFLFLSKLGVPTPQTWLAHEAPTAGFPLFMKPRRSSGSKGCRCLSNTEELDFHISRTDHSFVVQQLIKGPEITIDLLLDQNSEIIAAVARERLRVRSGLSVVSRTVPLGRALEAVADIARGGGLVGPANLQGFVADGEFSVFDVNTRFAAGGLPLAVASGVNLPLMAVKLALGQDVQPRLTYEHDLIMVRYYTEMYMKAEPCGRFVLADPPRSSVRGEKARGECA